MLTLGKKLDKIGQSSTLQSNCATNELTKQDCPILSGFNESPTSLFFKHFPDLDFSHEVLLAYYHQEIFSKMSDSIIPMESYIKSFKPESIVILGSVSQDDYKVVVSWAFSHSPEQKRETWIPVSFWMQQQESLELERSLENK